MKLFSKKPKFSIGDGFFGHINCFIIVDVYSIEIEEFFSNEKEYVYKLKPSKQLATHTMNFPEYIIKRLLKDKTWVHKKAKIN